MPFFVDAVAVVAWFFAARCARVLGTVDVARVLLERVMLGVFLGWCYGDVFSVVGVSRCF